MMVSTRIPSHRPAKVKQNIALAYIAEQLYFMRPGLNLRDSEENVLKEATGV